MTRHTFPLVVTQYIVTCGPPSCS